MRGLDAPPTGRRQQHPAARGGSRRRLRGSRNRRRAARLLRGHHPPMQTYMILFRSENNRFEAYKGDSLGPLQAVGPFESPQMAMQYAVILEIGPQFQVVPM